MKTVIVGAGALGTLLGAYLTKGGAQVTMLTRRAEAAKRLNDQEVEIRKPSGESFRARLDATADPNSLENTDLLIFSVKTYDTSEAVSSTAHLKERVQAVLSVQNGVEKDRILAKGFGEDKVIGGCCLEGASRLDDTSVLHTMSGITYLGEHGGQDTPRVRSAVKLFTQGGLNAEPSERVASADWCKWTNFAAAAAVCALTRLPYYKVLTNTHTAGLMGQMYREYASLAAANGVTVGDYPGFEVKTISGAPTPEAMELFCKRGKSLEAKGATKVMPSLAQDVVAGRRTEREAIFGFAVREGETKGVSMPFTRHTFALLSAIDENLGI